MKGRGSLVMGRGLGVGGVGRDLMSILVPGRDQEREQTPQMGRRTGRAGKEEEEDT